MGIAKKSIPVANVCTIVTTTRSKKKVHNFNLKFQQIKINYPQIFFKFFSYYLSLEKVFKKIAKFYPEKKIDTPCTYSFQSARAIEKLNECKKNVKKYPPFKFGHFEKKYISHQYNHFYY